ncbi:hypothetical protein P4129_02230 [Pseudomonas aeruginosa]|nr:hypothetical protein [Pseudomonas aeruginosa]
MTHFVDKQFYNTFDELYVLMLTNKQASYSQSAIDAITNGAFEFSTKNHIIDLGDILAKVSGLRIPAQERVLNDFKIILGTSRHIWTSMLRKPSISHTDFQPYYDNTA